VSRLGLGGNPSFTPVFLPVFPIVTMKSVAAERFYGLIVNCSTCWSYPLVTGKSSPQNIVYYKNKLMRADVFIYTL
jgi:hypothetical protein